jgi:3-dehydroquinate synthase
LTEPDTFVEVMAVRQYYLETCRQEKCEIVIERGALDYVGQRLRDVCPDAKRVVVVTDRHVRELHANQTAHSILDVGFDCDVLDVPPGEPSKSQAIAVYLWEQLTTLGFRRRDTIVALGGGVITDLAGFVAATYMRSVPYVNVPTTLVAQLDAAVGGKVAVNHERVKNLIGAFYHPRAVCVDPNVLITLPKQEIRYGLAEAIKVAIIGSPPLFRLIETHCEALLNCDLPILSQVVIEALRVKAELISSDPYERELRRSLNFGHTIGHALETEMAHQGITHGAAVSIGIAAATRIAVQKGICDPKTARRVVNLLIQVGLPTSAPDKDPRQVWESIRTITLIRGGGIHFVLPMRIGEVTITEDISGADIPRCLVEGAL